MDGTGALLQAAIPCTVAHLWSTASYSPGHPLMHNSRISAQTLLQHLIRLQHSTAFACPADSAPPAPDSRADLPRVQYCQTSLGTAANQHPWHQGLHGKCHEL